jgi:hypothetical protein
MTRNDMQGTPLRWGGGMMQFGLRVAATLCLLAVCGVARSEEPSLFASLEQLARSGNAEALYHVGMGYQVGLGVPKDHAKALEAFRKAAALGDPLASYKLGCYYAGQDGAVLAPDPKLALKYKLIAAEAGYALAQQDVAAIHARNGDLPTAITWLTRSADQGWAGALMALASIYSGAPGVDPDPARAAAYVRLSLARSGPSLKQTEWLDQLEARLSPAEKQRAEALVNNFRPTPTPLTIKAMAGQRAARALIDSVPLR